MAMRDLMPWSRGGDVPAPRFVDDPFQALQREMNQTFDEFFRGLDMPPARRAGRVMVWPRVDVSETDKEVKVVAELPGMEEKDVEVTLHPDGVLTLKGEKKIESDGGKQQYRERWHGQFERSMQLGPEVDPEKINAAFKNGVLTITLGKRPEAESQVKRIPIGTS